MLVAKGGAAGGDRGGHPGGVHGHHVGVALDDDGLVPPGDVALGQIYAEKYRGLFVEHRLGGVDVLGGDRVVLEYPARTETDRLGTGAANRPQQPTVKPVHRATTTLPGQPGGLKLGELEAFPDHVLGEGVPARRREAAAELPGRGGVEVAVGEVLTRRGGLLGFQCGSVKLLGGGIGGDQTAAAATITLNAGATTGVTDRMTDPVRQEFDRLDEADVFDLLHEGIDVAAFAAAETVKVTVVGTNVKRRGLLVVKRAQALERVGTGPAQLHIITDEVLDADLVADGGNIGVGYAALA